LAQVSFEGLISGPLVSEDQDISTQSASSLLQERHVMSVAASSNNDIAAVEVMGLSDHTDAAVGHAPKKSGSSKSTGLVRGDSVLQRAGTQLARAATNMSLQRAGTLPTGDRELRQAATMPIMNDIEADRPWCCGLWKTQQFLGFVLAVVVAVVLMAVRPIHTYPHANDMLAITFLCAFFWVFEVLPLYVTALLPMFLLPLFEITSSEIVGNSYWNSIQMLFIGTFLLNIALEEVQLPKRAALWLMLKVGVVKPWLLLACLMGLCWVLAMFLNGIAVTLIITPCAVSLLNAARDQATGGAAGAAERGAEADDSDEERCEEVQRFSDALMLGIAYSATVGGMATLTGAIPNYYLTGQVIVNSHVSWVGWFIFALPVSAVVAVLAYVVLWARYLRGMKLQGVNHEAIQEDYDQLVEEVGTLSRDEVVVFLVTLTQCVLFIIRPYVLDTHIKTAYGLPLINDASLAIMTSCSLFIIPSQVRPGQSILTWLSVHEKFDFGTLLLIGGGFAINRGFVESGLNVCLGNSLASVAKHSTSNYGLTLLIVCITSIMAQAFSAIGTAASMLPVLASASQIAVTNPLALLLPATVACSFAFMLPTATPANVVVLAKSQELPRSLRVRDFFLTGLPLNIAAAFVGAAIINVMGSVVFNSSEPFPRYACAATNCKWLPIEGEVQGVQVWCQACILDDETNDATCRLWNGTEANVLQWLPELDGAPQPQYDMPPAPSADSDAPAPSADAPAPSADGGAMSPMPEPIADGGAVSSVP